MNGARRRVKEQPLARIWLLDRETPPPVSPTARDHAARLLRWVRENGYGGKLVLAMDLQKIYPIMCTLFDGRVALIRIAILMSPAAASSVVPTSINELLELRACHCEFADSKWLRDSHPVQRSL